MTVKELLFGIKDDTPPSQAELITKAHQYFAEHGKGLTEGKVKKKFGSTTIIVSFIMDDGKTQS